MTVPKAVPGDLYDYQTGAYIRAATQAETDASVAAAALDGGPGVITLEDRRCYVQGGQATPAAGDMWAWAPDICQVCGTQVGAGLRFMHLGLCETCADAPKH